MKRYDFATARFSVAHMAFKLQTIRKCPIVQCGIRHLPSSPYGTCSEPNTREGISVICVFPFTTQSSGIPQFFRAALPACRNRSDTARRISLRRMSHAYLWFVRFNQLGKRVCQQSANRANVFQNMFEKRNNNNSNIDKPTTAT